MDKFKIQGPCRLAGEVTISGAKNAALPILQGLAGLCAGIVELACLPDDDGAGTDDHDGLDIGSFRHVIPRVRRKLLALYSLRGTAQGASVFARDATYFAVHSGP